jgi:hypothetical protein
MVAIFGVNESRSFFAPFSAARLFLSTASFNTASFADSLRVAGPTEERREREAFVIADFRLRMDLRLSSEGLNEETISSGISESSRALSDRFYNHVDFWRQSII